MVDIQYNKTMLDLIIFGVGGLSKDVHFIVDYINSIKPTFNLRGFIDDNVNQHKLINGVPYLGSSDYIKRIDYKALLVIAVSNPTVIKKIIELGSENPFVEFPNLIHPTAIIDHQFLKIGKGNIINASCIISRNVVIGDFNIFNNNACIGHDVEIGHLNTFSPKVQISGNVIIGNENFFGLNASIVQNKSVGNLNFVGACSLLTKSLRDNRKVFGIPARNLI
jgi:sugar O-acyltransferase (sialic acid O-acetyltransferase NeuD family)